MTIIPFYNVIVLPGISFFFQKDYFRELTGKTAAAGDDLLFLSLKSDKTRLEITPEDVHPVAVKGIVESIGDEGEIGIRTQKRVNLQIDKIEAGEAEFSMSDRPEIDDLPAEEEDRRFEIVKRSYLKFLSDSQWGTIAQAMMAQWSSLSEMISTISIRLPIPEEEKYAILAEDSRAKRTDMMEKAVYELLEQAKVTTQAEKKVSAENEQRYREDAIRRQIDVLQGALDEMHPENETDIARFERLIAESGMNETARKEAERVLGRLKMENKSGSEYGLLYDYLDFVTGLKWTPDPQEEIDLGKAEEILDRDHYGMKKVKRRVLEQMAVMALRGKVTGSILLFVGPPGTGKTSIGAGIAEALGRKYVRVSLGGIHDEAEIRGHRRTYIGAMPGRIMDGIRKCGSASPVMVLDEVDKLTRDLSRDPSSALLEVLDPEQNFSFTDHYMNAPYDLSNVLFICTANTTDTIPQPLLDRCEMIRFDGYTQTEKMQIARKHLLPAAMERAGMKKSMLRITDDAIREIISGYTAESGVRGLRRCLEEVCRTAAVRLVKGEQKTVSVSAKRLPEILDERPARHEKALKKGLPGVVTGLAWTAAGGEILFVEAVFTEGTGKLTLTGKLGDVMKESATIAATYVKAQIPHMAEKMEKKDLHIHVPEGAVPKDGPSAGITMACAITSALTGQCARPEVGMTGELSLRGRVLPIGGLTEKLMAAQRAGLKTILIPEENKPDLMKVPEEVRNRLEILPVSDAREAMRLCGVLGNTETGGLA